MCRYSFFIVTIANAVNRFLIAGLGNIGLQYAHTRHNVGFDVVDAFVARHNGIFISSRLADRAEIKIKGRTAICIKPTTFMNLSGRAFRYWLDKEQIELSHTLTVVDELALPLSKIRLRGTGSDGGHNGLKDIQLLLGTGDFPKLRFGIGNNYPKGMQAEFVLGHWFPEDKPLVLKKIHACADLIESFILAGIDTTMNQYNKMVFE